MGWMGLNGVGLTEAVPVCPHPISQRLRGTAPQFPPVHSRGQTPYPTYPTYPTASPPKKTPTPVWQRGQMAEGGNPSRPPPPPFPPDRRGGAVGAGPGGGRAGALAVRLGGIRARPPPRAARALRAASAASARPAPRLRRRHRAALLRAPRGQNPHRDPHPRHAALRGGLLLALRPHAVTGGRWVLTELWPSGRWGWDLGRWGGEMGGEGPTALRGRAEGRVWVIYKGQINGLSRPHRSPSIRVLLLTAPTPSPIPAQPHPPQNSPFLIPVCPSIIPLQTPARC